VDRLAGSGIQRVTGRQGDGGGGGSPMPPQKPPLATTWVSIAGMSLSSSIGYRPADQCPFVGVFKKHHLRCRQAGGLGGELATRMSTLLSGWITIQALTSALHWTFSAASMARNGAIFRCWGLLAT